MATLSYRVRRLHIRNIKSHLDTEIEFSDGMNIIQGDIGSGKSTILQSIESALFGYGMTSLLRAGESEGMIEILLDPMIQISWRLTSKGVKGGEVFDGNIVTKLSAGEIRSFTTKKLELLESASVKSEPSIFRTAVYVRQEELKKILDEQKGAEDLIRRSTGLVRYSIARDNAGEIARILKSKSDELAAQERLLANEVDANRDSEIRLRSAKRELEDVRKSLDSLKPTYETLKTHREALLGDIKGLEATIAMHRASVSDRQKAIDNLKNELKRLKQTLAEKEAKEHEYALKLDLSGLNATGDDIDTEIAKLMDEKSTIAARISTAEQLSSEISRKKTQIEELRTKIEEEAKAVIPVSGLSEEQLSQKLEDLARRIVDLRSHLQILEENLRNYTSLVREGRCYVCGSRIDPAGYEDHLEETQKEIKAVKEELTISERNYSETRNMLSVVRDNARHQYRIISLEENMTRLLAEVTEHADLISELTQLKKELASTLNKLNFLKLAKDTDSVRKQITEKESQLLDEEAELTALKEEIVHLERKYGTVDDEYKATEREYQDVEAKIQNLQRSEAALERTVAYEEARFEKFKKDLVGLDAIRKRLGMHSSAAQFFESMKPLLEQLENEKAAMVRSGLIRKMREYFSLLIQDEERSVKLDEDFTPIFQKRLNGEWSDIGSPSGGERSTMALSLRLALSAVTREVKGHRIGFILLDEPTDGFSDEQISRFQWVLERLDVPQVILVTHHRSLDNLAQRIIQVEYTSAGSRVNVIGQGI